MTAVWRKSKLTQLRVFKFLSRSKCLTPASRITPCSIELRLQASPPLPSVDCWNLQRSASELPPSRLEFADE